MSEAMSPILVAGGAGYIGGHIVRLLRGRGVPVVVLDNFSNALRASLPTDVAVVEGLKGDRDLAARTLEKYQPLAVVDLGGYPELRTNGLTPRDFYENNVVETVRFLETLVSEGIRNYIFSSSATVYGETANDPVPEYHKREPLTAYSRTMRTCEDAVIDIFSGSDRRNLVLRYFNVAGAMEDLSFGQTMPNAYHVMSASLNVAFGTVKKVNAYGNNFDTPDGTGIRDYIHVQDLADIHVRAVERLLSDSGSNDVINCSYGHGWSILEITRAVSRVTGKDIPVNFVEQRGGFSGVSVLDNSKLTNNWKWKPKFDDLDAIVGHAYQWRSKREKSSVKRPM